MGGRGSRECYTKTTWDEDQQALSQPCLCMGRSQAPVYPCIKQVMVPSWRMSWPVEAGLGVLRMVAWGSV